MNLSFTPDKDSYSENETIWLRTILSDKQVGPVADATVTVTIRWERPLRGEDSPWHAPDDLSVKLVPLRRKPGGFEGLLYGPAVNGYYRLIARATHPDLAEATADAIIAVETKA